MTSSRCRTTRTGTRSWQRVKLLDPHEVLAVVEIVSPSTCRRDRVLKPDAYASVGIGCYWRVELSPYRGSTAVPAILVHALDGDRYRLVETLQEGRTGETHRWPNLAAERRAR